jgi:hypothetical protein
MVPVDQSTGAKKRAGANHPLQRGDSQRKRGYDTSTKRGKWTEGQSVSNSARRLSAMRHQIGGFHAQSLVGTLPSDVILCDAASTIRSMRTRIGTTFFEMMHYKREHTDEPALQKQYMKASAACKTTHELATTLKLANIRDGTEWVSGLETTSKFNRRSKLETKGHLNPNRRPVDAIKKGQRVMCHKAGVESTNKSILPYCFSSRGTQQIRQLSDAGLPSTDLGFSNT